MVVQREFSLGPFTRGFHLITDQVSSHLGTLPDNGILHLFVKHTSAGVSINENCDPTVLMDFESVFNYMVPENLPFLRHTTEGPDDMPAHIKAVITGSSITIPITNQTLNLGIWQGIYVCEFRNFAGPRLFVATLIGEKVII